MGKSATPIAAPVLTTAKGRMRKPPRRGALVHAHEIEPGRGVPNNWDKALIETWAERKARRQREAGAVGARTADLLSGRAVEISAVAEALDGAGFRRLGGEVATSATQLACAAETLRALLEGGDE